MINTAQKLITILLLALMSGSLFSSEKPQGDLLTEDKSVTTLSGNTFTAPRDWFLSFVSISPGWAGIEFIVGDGQTLVLRDAQHEYVFVSK